MFEEGSGSTEIDENDVNEALDARTKILLRGKRYRLRRDVTLKWKVRKGEKHTVGKRGRRETRAKHSEHKARQGSAMFCWGKEGRKRGRWNNGGTA